MRLFLFGWLLVSVLGKLEAQTKPRPNRSAPNLFTYYYRSWIDANRVFCLTSNYHGGCQANEGTGASWPVPYYRQEYIFGSGLQIAGIIPSGAGFAWAGDTVGAFFFDMRGDQDAGQPRSDIYASLDSAAAANWPSAAIVRDPAIFDVRLIGRNVASEEDLWTRFWDGSPLAVSGRRHQMGLLVDQRLMAWNYPTGNQDILYFVLTLYNVTARDAAAYTNPTIPAELQSDIAAVGRAFQDSVEPAMGVTIPDGGYALDSVYVGWGVDHDIATISTNYATASLPFGLGIGYDGRFRDGVGWTYPPEIFGAAPFTPAPGLLGARFLRSPAPFALVTSFTGSSIFHNPVGVSQLWRYLSGNLDSLSGDPFCNGPAFPRNAKAHRFCYILQTQADSRFTMSSGPFQLGPGESKTIVMAFLFAAPLDTVNAYIGGDLKPGYPSLGDSIAADTTKITTIERIAGWRTQNDANGNGVIEPQEVTTARRSLLHKAQVAQAIVDAKFLMPAAPEAPDFFLIPGDNAVTVVWQPSATEQTGDPYYALASDRSSALYDPNYRQFDVEGYRIYRGTDPRALTLLVQLDHDNTTFVDYVGALDYPGRCAPELGIVTDCPVPFPATPDTLVSTKQRIGYQRIVQVPEGARITTGNGLVTIVRADTFPSASSGFPTPYETGVTYAFADSTVRNSFRYYYAVTAFDFNSIRSGPSSFESPRVAKVITPRAPSGQEVAGMVQAVQLIGGDGTILDTAAPLPTIDAATAIFSGPMPPTNGFDVTFTAFLPQLVATGTVTVVIDSVGTGMGTLDVLPGTERPTRYYLTVVSGVDTNHFTIPVQLDATTVVRDATGFERFSATAVDSAQGARFGATSRFMLSGKATVNAPGVFRLAIWGRADANGIPSNSAFNGPTWRISGADIPNPNGGNCAPSGGTCGDTRRVPNIGRTAGGIAGVTIFHPQSYNSIPNTPGRIGEAVLGTVVRAADFRVVWGVGGTIDSVIDVTHHVSVPFDTRARASWGILNQQSFTAVDPALTGDTRNDLLTWSDIFCVEPLPEFTPQCGGTAQIPAVLEPTAALNPIALRDTASSYAGTAAPSYTATGNGFIFYLNGHFFLMQLTAFPPAGTVWWARFYAGTITGSAAQANFAFEPAIRPPAVPGLRAQISFQGSQLNRSATTDSLLARAHPVPDPLYLFSGFETAPDTQVLKFVHLPALAIVRIYSLSGILVQALTNDDPTGGGELTWNLRSRNGRRIASGVYFYHIETPDHRTRVGRFTIITAR